MTSTMRAGVHARASTRLCAFSTARLFAASRVSAFARGHDARATRPFLHGPRGGGGGGAPPAFFSHRRPRRGRGRGAWQWRTVRARLDVAVRPDTYREELDAKIELARAHFAGDDGAGRAAIPLPRAEVFESARRHFRMRAEFRVWHEGDRSFLAMFDSADPKTPVEVPLFPMGSERINALMPKLLEEVMASDALRKKLFQVNFLTTVAGDAMISMLYHRRLAEEWIEAAEAARRRLGVSVVGRSRKQKVVLGNDFVMEELTVAGRALSYKQLEGGFTQPNAGVAAKMLEWARDAATRDAASKDSDGHAPDAKSSSSPSPRADDFLELYCGNGNFTIALAPLFRRVLATEVSKVSVRAALENLAANDVRNVSVVRLSSEELTQALDEKRRFERLGDVDLDALLLRTVLVDPPRAGMGPEVTEFVSRFPRIIYISCNPETLARDARGLAETHDVARFAAFDQFPYTPHLECGALFIKREEDGEGA